MQSEVKIKILVKEKCLDTLDKSTLSVITAYIDIDRYTF